MSYMLFRYWIMPAWFYLAGAGGLLFLASLYFPRLRAWQRDFLWLTVAACAVGSVCYSVMYFAPE